MQRREQFLQGLLELHKLPDTGTRRAAWRGSVASVARACAEDMPSPLEGLSPGAVVDSVRLALSTGLVDDLDWLSAASAGAALYEIASALPPGAEKREIGRRVLARLLEGNAASFVALATRMALGSGKGLGGDAVRARVALALAIPSWLGVRVDPLALALCSRRELGREWVGTPATGSLPDRRLSGRLLEQAARAIVRRVAQGDERSLSVLRGDAVTMAWQRLLEDREPLVWRHIAIARGLVAPYVPEYQETIERGFGAELSPTEWRRAATSLTAYGAVRPEQALKRLREVISRGFLKRDPGATGPLMWGLPAVAEVEPDAAEEMLALVVAAAPPGLLAEAIPELLALGPGGDFGKRAIAELREAVLHLAPPSTAADADDGALALRTRLLAEMGPRADRERSVSDAIHDGLHAFAEQGARPAFAAGLEALALSQGAMGTLEALEDSSGNDGRSSAIARRTAFSALRELDQGVLEDGLLHDLLVLGLRAPEAQRALEDADAIAERIAAWVAEREQEPLPRSGPVAHRTLRFHRLRALLHLADARVLDAREDGPTAQRARARCLRLANLMLRHLVTGPPPILHRMISAAYARAIDALLRDGGCDPADVLLVVAHRGLDTQDVSTLIEASMNPDLRAALEAYAGMLRALAAVEGGAGSLPPASLPPGGLGAMSLSMGSIPPPSLDVRTSTISLGRHGATGKKVAALLGLAKALDVDSSSRIDALGSAVLRVGRGLARILGASSLAELGGAASEGSSPIRELESALLALAQLCSGARQRMGDRGGEGLFGSLSLALSSAVDSALQGTGNEDLAFAVASAREELSIALPPLLTDVVVSVLDTLVLLPAVASIAPPEAGAPEPPLPAWLPRRRTLGGFYVVRALGAGTGGTVFMARRIEDRHDERADRFALKVPDYDGNAARTLSEEQFLQLFREEASALLGLPAHRHLARFVTFDLASRPKPILVMELVEGLSLERVILSNSLDMGRTFEILDGMLEGLDAMHSAGLGHLDLKPSNVILRQGREPVLVDFGLSGRHIRPGCATLPYGAPEIWGVVPEGMKPSPMGADIYAFGCVAYEMWTGQELFEAASEMALVTAHISHDGWPPRLAQFSEQEGCRPLADVLGKCLRRDPRDRASVEQLRAKLRTAAAGFEAGGPWPMLSPRRA